MQISLSNQRLAFYYINSPRPVRHNLPTLDRRSWIAYQNANQRRRLCKVPSLEPRKFEFLSRDIRKVEFRLVLVERCLAGSTLGDEPGHCPLSGGILRGQVEQFASRFGAKDTQRLGCRHIVR